MRPVQPFVAAIAFLLCSFASAQIAHDLTVFSEEGLKFTLLVNGEQINTTPQANVKVENTHYDYASLVIRFEDVNIAPIERKNVQIAQPGSGPKGPVAVVYTIKEKKGEHVLRFVSRSDKKIQDTRMIIIDDH